LLGATKSTVVALSAAAGAACGPGMLFLNILNKIKMFLIKATKLRISTVT
jgi:hypothetical protein